ncbi:MAG: hypothetical protein WHT06_15800 [Desulfobacterales bacterium]
MRSVSRRISPSICGRERDPAGEGGLEARVAEEERRPPDVKGGKGGRENPGVRSGAPVAVGRRGRQRDGGVQGFDVDRGGSDEGGGSAGGEQGKRPVAEHETLGRHLDGGAFGPFGVQTEIMELEAVQPGAAHGADFEFDPPGNPGPRPGDAR